MQKTLTFEKYQGTGNDFILIDHRDASVIKHADRALIAQLCDRRFGIGADGLILLEKSTLADFRMVYFNSDGRQSTMCGNGGRCLVQFAYSKGIFDHSTTFEAMDGLHQGEVTIAGLVRLEMIDVQHIAQIDNVTFEVNTGSPHFVRFGNIPTDIKSAGAAIRYNERYQHEGINVNFVHPSPTCIEVATYERGVEDETYSCGTGVTAAALAFSAMQAQFGQIEQAIQTKGGTLTVRAQHHQDGSFTNIWLEGPAVKVFEGKIEVRLT